MICVTNIRIFVRNFSRKLLEKNCLKNQGTDEKILLNCISEINFSEVWIGLRAWEYVCCPMADPNNYIKFLSKVPYYEGSWTTR
jgi:hypothetical protein